MVSHRKSHIQKRIVQFSQGKNVGNLCRYKKVKKKVTWDKSIAIREEEIRELENETQGPKESLPIVTFIGKHNPKNGVKDPHPFYGQGSRARQVTLFNLEDGRVDVPEVLGHLGAAQLEFEQEPGVWRTLEGLTSGKSRSQFKSGQVVFFRIILKVQSVPESSNGPKRYRSPMKCRSNAANKQLATIHPQRSLRNPILQGRRTPWIDKWIVEGDTVDDYYGRVGRLIEDRREQGGGLCGIGIVLRLAFHHKHTRLLLTCRHMVAQEGEANLATRGKLYAFGGPVKVLHTSNKYDLALLQGPLSPGSKGFDLAPDGDEQPGREVRLLTFPWYLDNVWGQLPLKDVRPAEMPGRIAYLDVGQERPNKPLVVDALATYMGGLPGCSGGAVTLNSKLLCGVHSGVYPFRSQDKMPSAIFVAENNPPHESNKYRSKIMKETSTMVVGPHLQRLGKRKLQALQLRGSPVFTKCSSTHGYLAVYVSSTHIRETCLEWYTKPGIKKLLDSFLPY